MSELSTIRRELNKINEALAVKDLVNRKEAIKITGRTPGTFRSYLSKGKYRVASIGTDGQEYFSEKELKGL
jgi:hypothetical protein